MKKLIGLSILSVLLLALIGIAQGPDRDLYFERIIPSTLEVGRLDRNLSATSRWPQWFHSLEKVTITDPTGTPQDSFQNGSIVHLRIDPKKGSKKPFDLTFQITEYQPSRSLGLKLLGDTSGRLTRLFDRFEWKIQLNELVGKDLRQDKNGVLRKSQITATATAHTHHWKARLFGGLTEKILMNQTFYPDIIKLAELRQPFSAEIPPQSLGLSGPGQ